MKKKVLEFLDKYKLILLIGVTLISAFLFAIFNTFSEKITSTIWDGQVAYYFKNGTGSEDDPYIIKNGSEFALLMQIMTEEDNSLYRSKYYALDNNIDFNKIPFKLYPKKLSFNGILDGRGYTLSNMIVDKYYTQDDINYYSLFPMLENAVIANINFNNININVQTNNSKVALITNYSNKSAIRDISLTNLKINEIYELEESEERNIELAGIINRDENSNFYNIFLNNEIQNDTYYNLISDYNNSRINNIIGNESKKISNKELDNTTIYTFKNENNNIVLNGSKSLNDVLNDFNELSLYTWNIRNGSLRMLNRGANAARLKVSRAASIYPTAPESSIDGTTVYVNDYESDFNYYLGLNYTEITGADLPTPTTKYSSSNLVPVKISYSGCDYNNLSLCGTVSPNGVDSSENQNKYVYYKYYYISGGNIVIDLIDNPFTGRPTDKAFNGWGVRSIIIDEIDITNQGTISYDDTYYQRRLTIPVSSTNKVVEVSLNAVWTKSNEVTGTNSNISGFQDKGMYSLSNTATQKTQNYTIAEFDHTEYLFKEEYDYTKNSETVTSTYSRVETQNQQRNCISWRGNGNCRTWGTTTNVGTPTITETATAINDIPANTYLDDATLLDANTNCVRENSTNVQNGNETTNDTAWTGDRNTQTRVHTTTSTITVTCTYYPKNTDTIYNSSNTYYVVDNGSLVRVTTTNGYLNSRDVYRERDVTRNVGYNLPFDSNSLLTTYYYKMSSSSTSPLYYNNNGFACDTVTCSNTNTYKLLQANDTYSSWRTVKNNAIDANINVSTTIDNTFKTYINEVCHLQRFSEITVCDELENSLALQKNNNKYVYNNDMLQINTTAASTYLNSCETICNTMITEVQQRISAYINNQIDSSLNTSLGNYFYFATRDINILYLNQSGTNMQNYSSTYPYTLSTKGSYTINRGTMTAGNDMVIENINIVGGTSANYNLVGSNYNFKVGRHVTPTTSTHYTFNSVVGGNTAANIENVKKYTLIVESGSYYQGDTTSTYSNYKSDVIGIYGSDYDRVNNDNDNLRIEFRLYSGTSNYQESEVANKPFVTVDIKSGCYGCGSNFEFSDEASAAIYMLSNTSNRSRSLSKVIVEGGYIKTIQGGAGFYTSASNTNNAAAIYVKNGTVGTIFGGARLNTTYGNRLISVTGGTVLFNIFGASNAYDSGEGQLSGNTLVYVGGTTKVGSDNSSNYAASLRFNVEIGNVFGAGLGRSGGSAGIANQSTIIINGGEIQNSVYGGGNYGAIGTNVNESAVTIKLLDGTINGNVFGGANQANSGRTDNSSATVLNKLAKDYYIAESVTSTNTIVTSQSKSRTCTNNGNVRIQNGNCQYEERVWFFTTWNNKDFDAEVIGQEQTYDNNRTEYIPSGYYKLNGSISEYEICDASNADSIQTININNKNNWDEWTPQTKESTAKSITQTSRWESQNGNAYICKYINEDNKISAGSSYIMQDDLEYYEKNSDGTYTKVNNLEYENGMGVENSYNHSINITLDGATINGSIYGGSNTSGTVYGNVNIELKSGTVNANIASGGSSDSGVYGGGKGENTTVLGHTNVKTNTEDNNSLIIYDIYGGSEKGKVNGNNNVSGETTVTINGGTINNVYGGGKGSENITPYTYGPVTVNVNSGEITNVYGANNLLGMPNETITVNVNGGITNTVYGGGNTAEINTATVNLKNGTVTSVFGGCNQADAETTNVIVTGGTCENVFGGSNSSGTVTTSNVTILGGTTTAVYGGNNIDGETTTTNVTVSDGTISDSVYGGGNYAKSETTNVNISGGNITSNVYGGGNHAKVTENTNVEVSNGTVSDSVYGGGNQGEVESDTKVTISGGTAVNVYGGGNDADVLGKTEVIIKNGTISSSIYGGGNNGKIIGNTNVSFEKGTTTTIYGGGNRGEIESNTIVSVSGGNIVDMYGGGNAAGVTGNTEVKITGGTSTGSIFGGGNEGEITGNTNVSFENGNSITIYGGGNNARVLGSTDVLIKSGTINTVYGGGNQGAIESNTKVTVSGGNTKIVYGGGNAAGVTGNTEVFIVGGTIDGNVFGGGNQGTVTGNTNVIANNATIHRSLYAGGNGASAIVYGNTNANVGGSTIIGTESCTIYNTCGVFGGGNAAATGSSSSNSSVASVKIVGGTIYGNIYGGANTSVVYGNTNVNIGATPTTDIIKSDIMIRGTVFGGGEANASGSDIYDYSFISVTKGISVNVNGEGYNNFDINGSIFGSGNASSSAGTSEINIDNYGTFNNPKHVISIQRTNTLTINNSSLVLKGATDRTNEYSDVLFTLSLIDLLKLKNNSTLYLETSANLLKEFQSLTSDNQIAVVTIDSDNKRVTKNVDNRIYMLEGEKLNIAKNERVTDYGEVTGMTFFGMYKYNSNGTINTGIYNKYDYDDQLNWGDVFNDGSYVLGLHKVNHNIEKDGFYSNYIDEATSKNVIKYIEPTPENSPMYIWVIGEIVVEYEVDLVASKYSTLGLVELSFIDFTEANTSFEILDFDISKLADGVQLVDKNSIPRVANSAEKADNIIGLTLESGSTGWLTSGNTQFITSPNKTMTGVQKYIGENTLNVPTLSFYLYHSKNIATSGDMGTVSIMVMAITQVDDLTKKTERLIINCNLSRTLYSDNNYEATLTEGRKYELFLGTGANISSSSAISAYYSLFIQDKKSYYKNGYYRALVSNYVLPENTKITMIDLSNENAVKYYYHTITAEDVANATTELATAGDIRYLFSMFEVMGAENSGVYYNDALKNIEYYSNSTGVSSEEFIFIVDFADTTITENKIGNSLLIEMLSNNNETILGVLGIQQPNMVYNIYANTDAILDLDGTISENKIYMGQDVTMNLTTNYTQKTVGSVTIKDTHYLNSKLGLKLSLIDEDGERVTGTSLLGLYFEMNGVRYSPDIEGITRIKVADQVGNSQIWLKMVTGTASLPSGKYTLRIESFGSPDGIYYGLTPSDTLELELEIVNEIYGLDFKTTAEEMIFDAKTGKNVKGSNYIHYDVSYNSGLSNPSIRLKMYRRKYNTEYQTEFTEVNLMDYITNTDVYSTNKANEYLVISNPSEMNIINLYFKENLLTGTYKLEFILYDGNSAIGTVEKYTIIK